MLFPNGFGGLLLLLLPKGLGGLLLFPNGFGGLLLLELELIVSKDGKSLSPPPNGLALPLLPLL